MPVDVCGGAFVCCVAAGGLRSAAVVRSGGLFVWGGEGVVGGVDRKVKGNVVHVALRDRIVRGMGELLEGGGGVGGERGRGGAGELPKSGVWWGKPRLVTSIKVRGLGFRV